MIPKEIADISLQREYDDVRESLREEKSGLTTGPNLI